VILVQVDWTDEMDAYFLPPHKGADFRVRKLSEELQAVELQHPTDRSEYYWFPYNVLARAA